MEDKAKLYQKMAAVMKLVQRVPKEGRNEFHKYNYATADDIADAIRTAMGEVNLAFLPSMVSVAQEPMTKGTRTHAVFEFTFACGETGATHTCRWEAEADDSGDKGINKVATAAEKYFLLKTFIVSTGDEPDADKEEGLHPSPTAPAQPKNGTPPPIATWKQNLKALEALVLKQVYNGNRFHMEGSFKKAEAEGDLKPDMTVEQAAIALKQRKLRAMAPKQAPQPAADFQYHVGDTVTFPPDRVTEEHLPLVYKVTATHPEAGTVEIFTAPTADNPIRLTVPAADVEPCDDVPF